MDYQPLYYALFNKITDVIQELQAIQQQTEELYILAEEPKELKKTTEIHSEGY